ncbi:MAG: hypothetical protein MJ223_02835 [Mycoplasmoidaceae bacterium]|nr:hypothetical protein [Mycoplasmoidaceae bacterium]
MVPVGEVFFGGSRESLQWNMNSPLMQFMIMGIIIAVVIIAIMFIALLIEHSIGRKQVNFMSKLK